MRRKLKKFIKKHLKQELLLLVLIVGLLSTGTIFLWLSTFQVPDLSAFESRQVSQSTKIYDRTGEILLYDIHQNAKRTIIPYGEISRNIKNATVAIEDSEFYSHRGIKLRAILRAVFANIGAQSYSQGGSTITQQVVKNSILTTEKTITRKIKEWVLALKLEKVLDKDSILGIYLNESPYGGSVYGIEEASQTFFGKKASDVSLAEAAYLASLPNAPTYYSPYGNNRDQLELRKNLVLRRMLENNFITEDEYSSAKAEVVTFKPQADYGIRAPHFVMFVKQYLEDKYGETVVENGGLKVITTLDYTLQEKAEAIVKKYAEKNKTEVNAGNAALVAIDPKTGGILTMVGSRDYFDKEIDGNFNVAIAHRQPGSSFKPFVYANAFLKGYTPETVVFDVETEFSTACNPDSTPKVPGREKDCYNPVNYDGGYRGPISLRNALAQSINIPAIKVLYLAGLEDSLRLAKDFGIQGLTNAEQYGLTLVLGGGEVSPLDMTSAYSVFANDGERNPYQSVLRIEDRSGKVLESLETHPTRIIPANTARQISSILSDNTARAPIFGERSYLRFDDVQVAVKTGTTNDYRDAWTVGYTPEVAVGAWVGNNDNSPMVKKIAGLLIAPMWREVMQEANKLYPPTPFLNPETPDLSLLKPIFRGLWQGNQSYFVDKLSGGLATEFTPPQMREEKVIRQVHTILYWVDRSNPYGPPPIQPSNDPQFVNWEYSVRKWAEANGLFDETASVIPNKTDSIHLPESAPKISITSPLPGSQFTPGARVYVNISNVSRFPIAKADFYINNNFAGSAVKSPYDFSFTTADYDWFVKSNILKVVAFDAVGNKGEASVNFEITGI